jgi:hypothetical protein
LSLVVLFVIISRAAPVLSFALAWMLQCRKGQAIQELLQAIIRARDTGLGEADGHN